MGKKPGIWEILRQSLILAKDGIRKKNDTNSLGILWYLLEPLSLFFVLIFLIEIIIERSQPNYPIYLLIGLVVFNFFRQSTMQGMNAINDKNIKTKFNPEVFVIAKFFQSAYAHLFELGLLIVFLIFYGNSLLGLIFYPLIFVFFGSFVLGLSFILAAGRIFFEDLHNLWFVLVRSLWFLTPTFYFVEKTDGIYRINLINPVFYFISILRNIILYSKTSELWMVFTAMTFSLFILVFGLYFFLRVKDRFRDNLIPKK